MNHKLASLLLYLTILFAVVILFGCGGGTRGTGASILEAKFLTEEDLPITNTPVTITSFDSAALIVDEASGKTDSTGSIIVSLKLAESEPAVIFKLSSATGEEVTTVKLEANIDRIVINLRRRATRGEFEVIKLEQTRRPNVQGIIPNVDPITSGDSSRSPDRPDSGNPEIKDPARDPNAERKDQGKYNLVKDGHKRL